MPSLPRYEYADGVAVITGAAGGIGAELAAGLAERGSHLALVDQRGDALAEVADAIRRDRPWLTVTTYDVDLSDHAEIPKLPERVLADHGRVTLLVNNAGVGLAGKFEQVHMEDVDWLLSINLRAVMAMTSEFLPVMGSGAHITNISSLFGLIAPIGNAAYVASKFGVRGFSLSLRRELLPRGIGVTTVHPGGIKTSIATASRRGRGVSDAEWAAGLAAFERFLVIESAVAARAIARGTERRRARVLIGPEAYAGDILARIAPASHQAVFEWLMRKKAGL